MIERNQQTPAMEYGANLRATVSDDDALESGHVRIEVDSTVSEAVVVRDRAQQLSEHFIANRNQLAADYEEQIRQLTEVRDAVLAKDNVYIGRAKDIEDDADAYAKLKTEYDKGLNALTAEIENIEGRIGAHEAYRNDIENQQAIQESIIDELNDESRSIDAILIELTRRASQLEERFVQQEASQEQLEDHYAYGAPTSYHHGINNLSAEEQRQYRELNERFAQCQIEIRSARERSRDLMRADVIAEGEINNLVADLQNKRAQLAQHRADGVHLDEEYNRIMALMDAVTEAYNVRFDTVQQEESVDLHQQEHQPEVNLRASVIDDEEVTGWVPDAGIRVLRADNKQPRKGRWSLKRNR